MVGVERGGVVRWTQEDQGPSVSSLVTSGTDIRPSVNYNGHSLLVIVRPGGGDSMSIISEVRKMFCSVSISARDSLFKGLSSQVT